MAKAGSIDPSVKNRGYDKAFLIDMDGVITKGRSLIPGSRDFVDRLQKGSFKFLFLTNNSYYTPGMLDENLCTLGISAGADHFYTSAMAVSSFLLYQKPGCSAFVIGGMGLIEELERAHITVTDKNPDYVIVGETNEYDYNKIVEATHLIHEGARFIATNPDITGPTERGPVPACGALVAPIEKVTGISPYFLGKPNPAMMYWARRKLGVHSASCFMIGDRMDTDIIGGIESGMTTCLVLSGVTSSDTASRFPYQPDYIFQSVGEIDPDAILSRRDRLE
jgi:NagD protein